MKTFSITDTGVLREMNQDYYFASEAGVGKLPNLFIVADGMGGHKAGDYASRYTTERVAAAVALDPFEDPVSVLKSAIQKANRILLEEAGEDEDKAGMGTTLVAATIYGNKLIAANIGDSRLYIIGRSIRQITRDHSLVDEMVRMGEILQSEARLHPDKNIITRAVGVAEDVEADFFEVELDKNDTVLLCTDGLTNMVRDEEICMILQENMSLEEKGERLVKAANQNGGRDNITVMLIQPLLD